jgi:radical SAM superfamily enzyme YgiQ (UPF0313 family)
MFDNTKPNVILLADNTNPFNQTKPLGVHKVAYVLRQAGYQVAVINHLHVFTIAEIIHLLAGLISEQTLFVGISNFFYKTIQHNHNGHFDVSESGAEAILPHGKHYNQLIKQTIKNLNPTCKLVLGGPTATDLPVFKDFDFVVIGYSELSVVNLADHLSVGVLLQKSYRSIYGPTMVVDPKADGYNFELSHMHYEDHDAVLPNEMLYLEVGRGCIFKCTFCSFPLNGKKKFDYVRNRNLIKKELVDNFERFGVTRYFFVDDTFNDSVEKCQMIADVSKELPFELEYWAYIRLDLLAAHPETIDLLINSGLRSMFCGIETFNQKTAVAIKKGGSREKLIDTIGYIKQKWGDLVTLQGSFILGLPYESLESIHQTIDYLTSDNNKLDTWNVTALRIHPPGYNLIEGFSSDLDKNYKKYGYDNLGNYSIEFRSNTPFMLWKNEFTNYLDMVKLEEEVNQKLKRDHKLSGVGIFELTGLDLPLMTVKASKNWDRKVGLQKKLSRAIQYKTLLFEKLNIDPVKTNNLTWDQQLSQCGDFFEYLKMIKESQTCLDPLPLNH